MREEGCCSTPLPLFADLLKQTQSEDFRWLHLVSEDVLFDERLLHEHFIDALRQMGELIVEKEPKEFELLLQKQRQNGAGTIDLDDFQHVAIIDEDENGSVAQSSTNIAQRMLENLVPEIDDSITSTAFHLICDKRRKIIQRIALAMARERERQRLLLQAKPSSSSSSQSPQSQNVVSSSSTTGVSPTNVTIAAATTTTTAAAATTTTTTNAVVSPAPSSVSSSASSPPPSASPPTTAAGASKYSYYSYAASTSKTITNPTASTSVLEPFLTSSSSAPPPPSSTSSSSTTTPPSPLSPTQVRKWNSSQIATKIPLSIRLESAANVDQLRQSLLQVVHSATAKETDRSSALHGLLCLAAAAGPLSQMVGAVRALLELMDAKISVAPMKELTQMFERLDKFREYRKFAVPLPEHYLGEMLVIDDIALFFFPLLALPSRVCRPLFYFSTLSEFIGSTNRSIGFSFVDHLCTAQLSLGHRRRTPIHSQHSWPVQVADA
jgi:hypothetical protein